MVPAAPRAASHFGATSKGATQPAANLGDLSVWPEVVALSGCKCRRRPLYRPSSEAIPPSPLLETPGLLQALKPMVIQLSRRVPTLVTSSPGSGKSLLIQHPLEIRWMAQQHRWDECQFSGPAEGDVSRQPISRWTKAVVGHGHYLLLPPTTLILEYSSGASVVTEGSFLPWSCVTQIAPPHIPDPHVLHAMLLTAHQDLKNKRATTAEV